MGLFSFLFGRKKPETQITVTVTQATDEFNYYTPKYFEILNSRPNISDFWGRDFDFPKYSDSFKTDEGYTLRELLLLVWWGKPKSGRKSSVTIPKYFFSDYNLNAEKLTRQFKNQGLIFDDGERTFLTDTGKIIVDKYQALWEIHSTKQYPTNLDIDFPTWNKDKFDLKIYQMEATYYSEHAKYCKRLVDFFNSLNAPADAQNVHNEINYYINEGTSDLARVNDLKEKIAIVQEKINTIQEIE